MKRTLAFGFALSLLSATAAFAAPETGTSPAAAPVVASHSVERMATAENTVAKPVQQFKLDLSSKALVAENNSAFGSKYQRY